ncbi:Phospholipase B1, membrane-associated [Holothuria leucospilota]|uniref:Phospholipase B1, membrane-associated n=1 Tax=Holothuria leucospilota TaxID=206669 RepID=A0A9Q1HFN5_HOLLE|nr:Phospholipase B1, membrane-associated [Holothuria leucospilota]
MKSVLPLLFLLSTAVCQESIGNADDNVWPTFLRAIGILDELSPLDEPCRVDYQHPYSFNCDTDISAGPPATSVHALRPHDVSVIGAMGDSLTAAFGSDACSLSEMVGEFRGRSWPVGGDLTIEEVSTLPNILKKYNPDLKGYSLGISGWGSEEAAFNTAISGGRSEHMTIMTEAMIEKMKEHPEVDFDNDWKVVTAFIGGNDLCQYCFNFHKYSAEQYVENIKQALDIMHREMPRTLVNVMGVLRVSDVDHLSGLTCDFIHIIACNCAMFKEGDDHAELVNLVNDYQALLEDLIMSGRYDTRDDFTVVYQPYLVNTRFPLLDTLEGDASYFAPDCFHFSAKGHAVAAKELWNNMLEPVGHKSTVWDPDSTYSCPTKENPYFFTNMNSGLTSAEYPPIGDDATKITTSVVAFVSSFVVYALK